MIIACLAQEAGALVRPLQEWWEFLTFLRQDPTRAQRVLDGKLPKPGEIGKAIGSRFKALRDSLSETASHYSFSWESMGHLLDLDTLNLRTTNAPSARVLRRNMGTLFALFLMTVGEALAQLAKSDPAAFDVLADRFKDLRQRGGIAYALEKMLGDKSRPDTPDAP